MFCRIWDSSNGCICILELIFTLRLELCIFFLRLMAILRQSVRDAHMLIRDWSIEVLTINEKIRTNNIKMDYLEWCLVFKANDLFHGIYMHKNMWFRKLKWQIIICILNWTCKTQLMEMLGLLYWLVKWYHLASSPSKPKGHKIGRSLFHGCCHFRRRINIYSIRLNTTLDVLSVTSVWNSHRWIFFRNTIVILNGEI